MKSFERDYEKMSAVENVKNWAEANGFSGPQFSRLRQSLRRRAIRRGFDSDYVRSLQRQAMANRESFAK